MMNGGGQQPGQHQGKHHSKGHGKNPLPVLLDGPVAVSLHEVFYLYAAQPPKPFALLVEELVRLEETD